MNFKYNDSGIRTEKTVNGKTTSYHLMGDKVTYETDGTDKIYYTYDGSDKLVSMNLNGVEYYYIRNAQEDIIGLHDSAGVVVVGYSYDSWGKLISTTGTLASTVGVKNPYRYRGYRYDTETSLYYLQSRYYNAEWGRFINADDTAVLQLAQGQLLGSNLFAYCMNNPVMNVDPTGHFIEAIIAGMGYAAIVYFVQLIGRYWYKGLRGALGMFNLRDFALTVLSGAIIGALGPYSAYVKVFFRPLYGKIAEYLGWTVALGVISYLTNVIYRGR